MVNDAVKGGKMVRWAKSKAGKGLAGRDVRFIVHILRFFEKRMDACLRHRGYSVQCAAEIRG